MANLLGIDITDDSVRVALLRTGYRRLSVEALEECSTAEYPTTAEAVRAVAGPLWARGDLVAATLPGDTMFVRRVELPPTATKQLAEVLPFELEAQLPFDLDEAIFDSRLLPRLDARSPLRVLAAVARADQIRERIDLIQAAVSQEPEIIDVSSFALANLAGIAPELSAPGPVILVHLDASTTDVAVLRGGQVEFVRTVTGGTAGLPATAKPLARDLRQTLYAWRGTGGETPAAVYVTGPGAQLSGAEAYLSSEVGIPVAQLPLPKIDGLTGDRADKASRFTRAIAIALSLNRNSRGMNLRRGSLAYERGYGFLREKVPLLAGIGTLIVASFMFSTWMEFRALDKETTVLEEALASVTTDVIGEPIRDPKMAEDNVSITTSKLDDPMPLVDGFDLMVEISKAVPPDVVHDIEELDYQKGHATIHGIVPTIPDAQQIASTLQTVKCFDNVKIVRTNQVVNENRQKYVLEFDVKCPTPGESKKKEGAKDDEADGSDKPKEDKE